MADGNLRSIFKSNLPEAHWVPVETWSTGQGVPDAEFCFPGGVAGWIENKKTGGWAVGLEPHQVAWHERRARVGGRTFIAVRRTVPAGPRRGAAEDQLWLFPGSLARRLMEAGLLGPDKPAGCWNGGPARWGWAEIAEILVR